MEQTRTLPLSRPLDLRRTFLVTGLKGPGQRIHGGALWRVSRTPDGLGTIRLSITATGELAASAWGPGAGWLLDRLTLLVGEEGADPTTMPVHHDVVGDLARRARGLRLPAVGTVVDVLLPVVLAQKVTGVAAGRSYAKLMARYGEPAPGPVTLTAGPDPYRVAQLPYYDLHPLGIEKKRADTLLRLCRHASSLETVAAGGDLARLSGALTALRGIGPWTAARTMMVVAGDPDAVPVGDYHIPNSVAWTLAREPRADDDRMLELLEPYRGWRGLLVRMIEAYAGHAPAYGPKLAPRTFQSH